MREITIHGRPWRPLEKFVPHLLVGVIFRQRQRSLCLPSRIKYNKKLDCNNLPLFSLNLIDIEKGKNVKRKKGIGNMRIVEEGKNGRREEGIRHYNMSRVAPRVQPSKLLTVFPVLVLRPVLLSQIPEEGLIHYKNNH